MYVALCREVQLPHTAITDLEDQVPEDRGSLGVFGMPEAPVVMAAAPVITVPEGYMLIQHKPVAARVVGGGTPSVVPTGAVGFILPEGAVLVSTSEATTSTVV
jgi:hypothetical protein